MSTWAKPMAAPMDNRTVFARSPLIHQRQSVKSAISRPVTQLAAGLLSRCPNLQILTTSREPLNITGETLWHVPTLDLPDPQQISLVKLLMDYECIRLFVETIFGTESKAVPNAELKSRYRTRLQPFG